MLKLTYDKLSRIADRHTPKYIRLLFHRRGWSINNPKQVIKYLLEFVDQEVLLMGDE